MLMEVLVQCWFVVLMRAATSSWPPKPDADDALMVVVVHAWMLLPAVQVLADSTTRCCSLAGCCLPAACLSACCMLVPVRFAQVAVFDWEEDLLLFFNIQLN